MTEQRTPERQPLTKEVSHGEEKSAGIVPNRSRVADFLRTLLLFVAVLLP